MPLEDVIETLETSEDPLLKKIVLVPSQESIEFSNSVNGDGIDSNANDNSLNVYRFRNQDTGVYFYTASEVEKNNIVVNLSNYTLEGAAYKAIDPLTGMDGVNTVSKPMILELEGQGKALAASIASVSYAEQYPLGQAKG